MASMSEYTAHGFSKLLIGIETQMVVSCYREYGKWEIGAGRGVDIVRHGGNGHYRSSFEDYVMAIMEDRDEHKEPL